MGDTLIVALNAFSRTVLGLIVRPYETCRKIAADGNYAELTYVGACLAVYFILASLVKVAAFRPFLLTRQFALLAAASVLTYMLVVALLWAVGRAVGGTGKLRSVAVGWGYSLVPTVVWFFVTSLLYVLLPPPRTTSWQGLLFSIVFLVFSAMMFFWKLTIGYLSIRFGLRLGLGKILIITAITIPVLALYSWGMYRLGIFRVPFV